jgi:hypothetical protein
VHIALTAPSAAFFVLSPRSSTQCEAPCNPPCDRQTRHTRSCTHTDTRPACTHAHTEARPYRRARPKIHHNPLNAFTHSPSRYCTSLRQSLRFLQISVAHPSLFLSDLCHELHTALPVSELFLGQMGINKASQRSVTYPLVSGTEGA